MEFPKTITDLLSAFSKIPYENLSKAIKFRTLGDAKAAVRSPAELFADNAALGTGGTCFSLTWALCGALREGGFDVYPVLCDRVYGNDTHCCAVWRFEGRKFLLDPGYLAFAPLELTTDRNTAVETVFNRIYQVPAAPDRYQVYTEYLGEKKLRFTVKDTLVSEVEFFRHWHDSFLQGSLKYPVVTLLKGDAHLYLQKERLYVRRKTGAHNIAVPRGQFSDVLQRHFGIHASISEEALKVF